MDILAPDRPAAVEVDCRVVRVRERETIADPGIRFLIMMAVVVTRYPGTTAQAFYDEIAGRISEDGLGVFVGIDETHRPAVLAIVMLPVGEAMMAPQVVLLYGTSRNPSLIKMTGTRVREWVKRHGYDRIIGVNLWHDDEAFCRMFRHVGETRVIGSLVEARV